MSISKQRLAIGLEKDWIKCLVIFGAVLIHKWIEGLTLGNYMRKSNINKKVTTIMIIIFAIMNTIGIGIGWILCDSEKFYMSIYMSISAGTFFYITTIIILEEEFNNIKYRFLKFFTFLIAVGIGSCFWFLEQYINQER
ncbi:zip zinc transporter family protein, putative [Ichthyophthirius multifiliis]|uniref:Zip zinc transporter family protein, putative n=1 Tax=Ichthyophthirius multifiliis TaxID=5932 RepID=G0QQP5_ICHMU|nr:zip zinc transporter family protein, putative [Ichthyophthirius multifiliis]EGR32463.1 zip zinc transporter family protein, putative [Ichthyophthirius multifiliis]|eukprot:XP_004036449.1 zip zinc transporter family protein, putative [Ichthyophthirius multifiliis]